MEAKQLKLTFLLAVLMSMVGAKAFAHDFAVANGDGKAIYYKYKRINNSTEVEVSYRGSSSSSYSNEYSGVVNWISPNAEFTPKTILTDDERADLVYAVKIAVRNDGGIKIGMYGKVRF